MPERRPRSSARAWLAIAASLAAASEAAALDAPPIDIVAAQELAVAGSDELRALAGQVGAAALSYDLGVRSYLPKLGLNYSDSRQVRYGGADTDSVQAGITVTQPLFDGGRNAIYRRLSAVQLRVKSEEFARAVEQVRDEAWLLYRQIQLERARLGAQDELSIVAADQLRIAETERRLGSLLEVDYLDARAEVQSLELQILKTRSALDELEWKMRRLIGIEPLDPLELEGRLDREYEGLSLTADARELAELAVERNPDLRAARVAAMQARVQYELSRLSFIPNISLECAASLSGTDFPLQNPSFSAKLQFQLPYQAAPVSITDSVTRTGLSAYGRGSSVSVSPLDDLSFLADERLAKSQAEAKEKAVRKAEREIEFSVSQQLGSITLKRRTLVLSRAVLDTQRKKLELMGKQLELGEVKRIEYVKSQVAFYNQEISLFESIQEIMLAERGLEKTLGLPAGELSRRYGDTTK